LHSKTQRLHTAYHEATVATGCLSSSRPNLQNIPIRTEEGRKVRRAFEAPKGYKILAADYSQIELRIMAHFSKDIALRNAFEKDQDVHAATASTLFNVSIKEVTKEQRRRAKGINFGLTYGMSAFGLASQLQLSQEDAKKNIDQYFERYPGVKNYMEKARHIAHAQSYVTTLFYRKLLLIVNKDRNKIVQEAAERAAINAPLQGIAADIIKRAMIAVTQGLKEQKIDAKIIMQVHYELVFEVKENPLSAAKTCIERGMQGAANLAVVLQ
jgi:DNA polymerase I